MRRACSKLQLISDPAPLDCSHFMARAQMEARTLSSPNNKFSWQCHLRKRDSHSFNCVECRNRWKRKMKIVELVSAFMLGFSCHTATRYYRCTAATPLLSYRSLKFPLGLFSHYTITVMNSKQIWRLCVCMRTGSFNKPFRYYRIIFQLHCIIIWKNQGDL